jgi:UDP-2-acetamido-3-amino-2,3-dideoxy-glucuronate N-acetyltransferase
MTGNPARFAGWMSENGHKLHFDNTGFAVCKETGERYQLTEGCVKKENRK